MSSSIVHLSLAVVSGVALGAAGALSLRKEQRPPPAQPTSPAQQGAPQGGKGVGGPGAGPAQAIGGGLPAREVRDRVVNGGTIGASLPRSLDPLKHRRADEQPPRTPRRRSPPALDHLRPTSSSSTGPISDLLMRQAYTAAYDRRNKIPAWTAEHLTAASLQSGGGDRQMARFVEDEAVPDLFRAKLLDYFKSGYDRGHMVPAADAKQSQTAMAETFLLSNIAPQVGEGFNRHYWAYLEAVRRSLLLPVAPSLLRETLMGPRVLCSQFCRNLTKSFDDVYVFTVPLFLPKRDGRDGKWRVVRPSSFSSLSRACVRVADSLCARRATR